MFTCLNSRAVHIEVTNDMTTDSFILALRRMIGRRGNIRIIRSDNGSNFVGAKNELNSALKEMDQEKIKRFLQNKGTDWLVWKFNTPLASHMGGVWERQIRSARRILTCLLNDHSEILNTESLQTLVTEVEAVINSRPLTVENLNDVKSDLPLSPATLLTMKSDVILPPPGSFDAADKFSRKYWKRVQHITNEFWDRWRKEFLTSLQTRQKWNKVTRNFTIGDIVLLKEQTDRNEWKMARIVNTEQDQDGMVRNVSVKVNVESTSKQEILRRPVVKIVLLVESEFDSPTREPVVCQDVPS